MAVEEVKIDVKVTDGSDVSVEYTTNNTQSSNSPVLAPMSDNSTQQGVGALQLEDVASPSHTTDDGTSLASIFQSPVAVISEHVGPKSEHTKTVETSSEDPDAAADHSKAHIHTCEDVLAEIHNQVTKTDPHIVLQSSEPIELDISTDQIAQHHAEKTAQISNHVAQIVTRISSLGEQLGMRAQDVDPKKSASQRPSHPTNSGPSVITSTSPFTTGAGNSADLKTPKAMAAATYTSSTTDSAMDVEANRKMSYETEPLRINPIKKPDPIELQTPLPKANKTPIRFTVRKASHEVSVRQTSQSSNSSLLRGSRAVSSSSKDSISDADEESREKMHSAKAKLKKLEASITSITAEIDYLKLCLPPHAPEPADYNDHMKIREFINVLETERDDLEKKRYDLGMYMSKLWGRKEDNRWVRNFSL